MKGKVAAVNAWGDSAASVFFTLGAGWRPANGRATASGWCYRTDLNIYYPCVCQWDGDGVCSAYAIASSGTTGNNYSIYANGIDNRRLFTVFLSGAWIVK